jgi:hypothetical protein
MSVGVKMSIGCFGRGRGGGDPVALLTSSHIYRDERAMIISAGGVAGQYYSWKGNPLG